MQCVWRWGVALLGLAALAGAAGAGPPGGGGGGGRHRGQETAQRFSNEWVVRLEGGPRAARALADELGYDFHGHVLGFEDTYRMVKSDHPRVHKRAHSRLTQRLAADARVVWAEQQFAKQRVKRSPPPPRSRRADLAVPLRDPALFNDELWSEQWYLQDTRTRTDLPKLDLHVLPLYALGVSGRGVRVSVLDDGVEHRHDDLRANYDPEISYDANDDDDDPTPRYDDGATNAHGTRCAGEIAMVANNGKCGVGVAFNARIGGVRLLDGEVNDRVEGTALGYAHKLVDIYSASWGPNDDGKTVEGPGTLALEALERGIREGRGGRGAIYVWASGNGGSRGDNCDCDGYIGSIYTLAVGSASQRGQFPWYGERCAATMATTYSSGAYTDQMIATTDLGNTCTVKHTGTSASAPLAAGIIALALEVNPELTWRDVQHLVVWTSEYAPLSDNEGWRRTAAGFWVNTRFGFGLMNAAALVAHAANWTTVPPAALCLVPATSGGNATLRAGGRVEVAFDTDACAGTDDEVNYLEHVQVEVNIDYPIRGELQVFLTSPSGTRVQLLGLRRLDDSAEGFAGWRFLSVLTWGERPRGRWLLQVHADPEGAAGKLGAGRVGACALLLHGTRRPPAHFANGPRLYDAHYNRVNRKTKKEEHSETTQSTEQQPESDIKPVVEGPEPADSPPAPAVPQYLELLQQQKGVSPLDWNDLEGLSLAMRESQRRATTRATSEETQTRNSVSRRWLQEVFHLMWA
ncbi:hypothetical protein R5R35_005255 [Gryllus longicercus]|uniref:furin n=1 Tax=Gryllus longicercus TaxID=2509291 RepID=A0AAN9VRH6_9ORTH